MLTRTPVIVQAHGRSMCPALRPDDWLEIGPARLQPGQIIVAQTEEGKPIVHRIIAVHGTSVITRGDNTHAPDSPWRPDQVLGQVQTIMRGQRSFAPHHRLTPWIRLLWLAAWLRHHGARAIRKVAKVDWTR